MTRRKRHDEPTDQAETADHDTAAEAEPDTGEPAGQQTTASPAGPPATITPQRAGDGRPKCTVDGCPLPEFMDTVGLCGGHYATRPDLRKGARRG